jgi:hypothetical protein
VIGFRRSCDLSELRSLKHRSAQLLQHLVELNSRLEPTAPS